MWYSIKELYVRYRTKRMKALAAFNNMNPNQVRQVINEHGFQLKNLSVQPIIELYFAINKSFKTYFFGKLTGLSTDYQINNKLHSPK